LSKIIRRQRLGGLLNFYYREASGEGKKEVA
jgi:hypothetical protein